MAKKRGAFLTVMVLSIIAIFILSLSFFIPNPQITAYVTANVYSSFEQTNETTVLVLLKDATAIKAKESKKEIPVKSMKKLVQNAQAKFEQLAPTLKGKIEHKFSIIPAVVMRISKEDFEKLKSIPNVVAIQANYDYSVLLDDSVPQMNVDDVWNLYFNGTHLNGSNIGICIVDTGVDYTHPALGGSFGVKVIAGYDFVNNDADPMDDHGHGTHCAGIAASEDQTYRGVAYGANIIAVKSLDSTGSGTSDTIASGIDWCVNNADTYNIKIISMSLGTTTYHSSTYCSGVDPVVEAAINAARAAGIIVFAAAGNEGQDGLSLPACIPNATPIGAVDKNDVFTAYSNRADILKLLAVGGSSSDTIMSTQLGGGFTGKYGTSMATPHAAGIAALLIQYEQLESGNELAPEEIESVLENTGKTITCDSYSFKRIDALAALLALDNQSPTLEFVQPTPANNSILDVPRIAINVTASETIDTFILSWNGTNEKLNCSGTNCIVTKRGHGTYFYKVIGNDSAGNYAETEERIVTLTDHAPMIDTTNPSQAQIIINETDNQTFQIKCSDVDNDTLTIIWFKNNESVKTDVSNNSNWTFTSDYLSSGNYAILAVCTDGILNTSTEWNLTVNDIDAPPQFNTSNPIPNQTWKVNTTNSNINLSQHFYDVDGDDINWTINSTLSYIENLTITINNDSGIVTITPDTNFLGTRNVIFIALGSGGRSQSNNVTLNVVENYRPQLENITLTSSDLLNRTNGTLIAHFDYCDKDNDSMQAFEITWYLNGTEKAELKNQTSVQPSYTEKGQNWSFSARVYDGYDWSDWYQSNILTIKNAAPNKPIISSPENNSYIQTVSIAYQATDIDGDNLTYYVYIDGSLNETTQNTSMTWQGEDGTHALTIKAYDGFLFSENASITFTKDTVAPTVIEISTSQSTEGSRKKVTLRVKTDEYAYCRYDYADVDYEDMENMTTSDHINHRAEEFFESSTSGEFYVRCKDRAGNIMQTSNSTSYSVTFESEDSQDTGGSGGGGGGGGGGTQTASQTDIHIFAQLSSSVQHEFNIYKTEIPFVSYAFAVIKPLKNVEIKTSRLTQLPDDVKPLEHVYSYIKVSTSGITDDDTSSVRIRFRVEKSWVKENKINLDTIALYRYQANEWQKLATSRREETALFYHYEAVSPGFSVFAIKGEYEKQQKAKPREEKNETPLYITQQSIFNESEDVQKEEQKRMINIDDKTLFLIVLVAVIAVIFNLFVISKIKNKMIVKKYKGRQKVRKKELKVKKKELKIKKKATPTKKRKTKIKQKKKTGKPRCPKCGSTDLARGYGDFYFCRHCGAVIKRKI
ncbi:S8 family serine peptidase [Candidatus Woesearchaeota archaeon]|nr:S8 family serine peptidase [Candidatus Woesearchaeota archaeon]